MEKYYEVVAKCGHVTRGYYYEGHFFVKDTNASHAAQRVKQYARVKTDHKDAILSITPIDYHTYIAGNNAQQNEAYFFCKNIQEQREHWSEIEKGIYPETDTQLNYRKSKMHQLYTKVHEKNGEGIRNPYKYSKYHKKVDIDYYGYGNIAV